MPNIVITALVLPPPACFTDEQSRLEAFVQAMVAELAGDIELQTSSDAPDDLTLYWLQTDADGRPLNFRKWSADDSQWAPLLGSTVRVDSVSGTANAITLSNTPPLPPALILMTGRRFQFVADSENTGAVTVNIDGAGAKSIKKLGTVDLDSGDISDGQIVDIVYNATLGYFELFTPTPPLFPAESVKKTLSAGIPAYGSSATMPHDQTKAPDNLRVCLKCVTAESGFSVGDMIDISGVTWKNGDETWPAFFVTSNATNVVVTRGGASLYVIKNTGALLLTDAKWSLVALAEFWPS